MTGLQLLYGDYQILDKYLHVKGSGKGGGGVQARKWHFGPFLKVFWT